MQQQERLSRLRSRDRDDPVTQHVALLLASVNKNKEIMDEGIKMLDEKLDTLLATVKRIEEKIDRMQEDIDKLDEKCDNLANRVRENNVDIYGVSETVKEIKREME